MTGSGTVTGIIDFGGGTAAAAGTTMNANDTITGTSTTSGDVLRVTLQNAGAAVGATVTAQAQVNTIDLVAPVANVQQVNQVVFTNPFATDGTQTFTYGGAAGAFTVDADVIATNAANLRTAINAVAGSDVAKLGGTVAVDGAQAAVGTTFTYDTTLAGTQITAGMSITGTSIPTGTTIVSFTATTITMSAATTATLADNAAITIGGGAGGVSVFAPTAGTASPALTLATTTGATQTLVRANVNGTVGDTVNFTYGGVAGSYVVQSTEQATADALVAAINNITGGVNGSATAARATNDVTITANVAGTPLPAIVFSGEAGTLPSVAFTTANRTAVGGISFGNNTGIDTLSINNISGQAATITAASAPGATNFTSDASSAAVTFSGLSAAQSVTKNAGAGNVTADFGGTVTAGTVNISGGSTAGVVTTSGTLLATNTINSTGAANTIGALTLGAAVTALNINATTNLTTAAVTNTGAAALTTITVTGAGAVDLSTNALQSTVTTINASGNSGGLTVALGSAVTQTVTGSSGNDVITTGALALTTGSVNAGAGTADVLNIGTNVGNVNTAAQAAKYTGFEILRMNGTMDASLISGITQVQLSGATNTISNLSAAQSVTARVDIGATTLAPVSGTTNTLNLTMGNDGTTTSAANSTALTINGYQTLNLTVTPGATRAVSTTGVERTTTIGAFTAANLTAINLTGTAAILSNAATTLAVAINGSALTGNGTTGTNAQGLTVAGNLVSGSSVIGSNLRDQFTLGTAAANTYNGGLGNDLFIGTVAQLGTGGAADPTLIGGVGTDTLSIINAGVAVSLADANFKSVTGFETLTIANTNIENVAITGLTTNANAAFATGLTVNVGTTADRMVDGKTFTFEGLAYANNVTLNLFTLAVGTTNAANISITTGAGNDTVTVTSAFAGANAGAATMVISTGSGVDTINLTTAATLLANTAQTVRITAGTGADVITVATHANSATAAGNVMFTVAAGDSTTTAYDAITGFVMATAGTISDNLDFASVAINTYTATAAAGYTAAQLTVAVASSGLVTLAGTSAATLSLADAIAAIQSVVTVGAGDTAVLNYATAGINSAYVFNNNATADSVVQLVGITAVSLNTNAAVTTAGHIVIS